MLKVIMCKTILNTKLRIEIKTPTLLMKCSVYWKFKWFFSLLCKGSRIQKKTSIAIFQNVGVVQVKIVKHDHIFSPASRAFKLWKKSFIDLSFCIRAHRFLHIYTNIIKIQSINQHLFMNVNINFLVSDFYIWFGLEQTLLTTICTKP